MTDPGPTGCTTGAHAAAARAAPDLSVIIPTLDEAATVPDLLHDLRALAVSYEVIVVDGGSRDGTGAAAERLGARVIDAPRGRGAQLAAGARVARGALLCFLHADVRLDHSAVAALDQLVHIGARGAYAFRLRIDAPAPTYRVIEWGANARSRWAGLPYGDQGLVVSRSDYERAGGYRPLPLMEDVALVRALARVTRVRTLDAALRVSSRRWLKHGPVRSTMRNWILLGAYLAGVSPERLERRYPRHRGATPPSAQDG